jgi:phytoene/squalene synthetase
MSTRSAPSQALAASITKAASKQTYYTIRLLVDRHLVPDAYRAYAYFRWVDDHLDRELSDDPARLDFIDRQRGLVDSCYFGLWPNDVTPEEGMLVDLIRHDRGEKRGLQTYIQEMLAVMAFDAGRQGRLISQAELDKYVRHLATAVTEALHYFIGHCCPSPQSEARYLAASGAHITHMLRDALEDNQAGYFNTPQEYLEAHAITPEHVNSPAYRAWVRRRVQLARRCFAAGKNYLAQVENFRCRLAGYAYIARFEGLLQTIEREGFHLRAEYREFKSPGFALKMIVAAFLQALWPQHAKIGLPHPGAPFPPRPELDSR